MRLGIAGAGMIVRGLFSFIHEIEGIELEAIASTEKSIEKVKQMAKENHVKKAYLNYDELLNDEDIEVMYIATPNHLHYQMCKQALEKGKNVICEKPFTSRIEELEELSQLAKEKHLIILCGHYEGIDQRVLDKIVDEEISIGDYVLTGGEIPAMALIDSVSRYVEGVLTGESIKEESFSEGLLEYPQYTRPEIFEGVKVPEVLLSGHHENINKWRKEQAIHITKTKRPDLLKNYSLSKKEILEK